MTVDAVLSFHMSPLLCGVAKFNHRLARELDVPCLPLHRHTLVKHPLVSISPNEVEVNALPIFGTPYDLFLHAIPTTPEYLLRRPHRLYAANAAIADAVRGVREDVITAWCPSTIEGNPHRAEINVLTFGMAHKIQLEKHRKLKRLLDATGQKYTVSLSTAVHEGSPWETVGDAATALRGVYGDSLRYLGYLADDAIVREILTSTAVALFFDPALRANNTTAWTVLDEGQLLITNHDAYSPAFGADIDRLTQWPEDLPRLSTRFWQWPSLKELMTHAVAPVIVATL